MVKVAIVQLPGSNCDLDALEILQKTVKVPTDLVWHKDLKEDQYDAYVLPGGFSYGDYLRAGAIAATSPSLETIREATVAGKPVLGICNKEGNVMGLMPHPERASLPILSLNNQPDGRLIFDSMIRSFENTVEGENR